MLPSGKEHEDGRATQHHAAAPAGTEDDPEAAKDQEEMITNADIEVFAASGIVIGAAGWALWLTRYRLLREYLWCLIGSVALNTVVWYVTRGYGLTSLAVYCVTALIIVGMVLRLAHDAGDEMPQHLYHIVAVAAFLQSLLCGLWMLPDLREGFGFLQLQFGIVLIEAMLLTASGIVLVSASIYSERQWLRTLGMTLVWQGIGKYVALAGSAQAPSGNWAKWSMWISTTIVASGLMKTGFDISLARRIRQLESIT